MYDSKIDKVEVVGEHNVVQVRTATDPVDELGEKKYHRYTITPGQDYSKEPPEVKDICQEFHTTEVVENYLKSIETESFTAEEQLTSLTSAVQRHLDVTASEKNYDSILSCTTYATSKNPKFKAEGQAAVEWRDDVWTACYQIMDEVKEGIREIPTELDIIEELPKMSWPVV